MIWLGKDKDPFHSLSSNENEKLDVLLHSLPSKGEVRCSLNSYLTKLIFTHLIKVSTFYLKCYFLHQSSDQEDVNYIH